MSDLLEDIEPIEPVPNLAWAEEPLVMRFTADDMDALAQLRVLLKKDSIDDVLLELLRRATPSRNGHGYEVICSGCGLTFQSDRRPLPGKKRWCENCRKTGEPAAQRARDYRARKAGQTT